MKLTQVSFPHCKYKQVYYFIEKSKLFYEIPKKNPINLMKYYINFERNQNQYILNFGFNNYQAQFLVRNLIS